ATHAAMAAVAIGTAYRTRHLRDESLLGARAVRAVGGDQWPAADPHRYGLRSVHLPWARCLHLRSLYRCQDDRRGHAGGVVAQSGRWRSPEFRHGLARDRVA